MSDVHIFSGRPGVGTAFRATPGDDPTIVFLPGYMSDMSGSKASALFEWAQANGRSCLLLDYSGCGQSLGEFADGTLTRWRDEVLALVEAKLSGRVILVGSSMGGWLMLLTARKLKERVAGLVGIAAAPDFTQWGYTHEQKAQLAQGTRVLEDNPYGPEPTPTHSGFWRDGQEQLQLEGEIPLDCPVRLLHGQEDAEVPPEISLQLSRKLHSSDVQVTLIKGGDHRLSREGDIALLLRTVESIR